MHLWGSGGLRSEALALGLAQRCKPCACAWTHWMLRMHHAEARADAPMAPRAMVPIHAGRKSEGDSERGRLPSAAWPSKEHPT